MQSNKRVGDRVHSSSFSFSLRAIRQGNENEAMASTHGDLGAVVVASASVAAAAAAAASAAAEGEVFSTFPAADFPSTVYHKKYV